MSLIEVRISHGTAVSLVTLVINGPDLGEALVEFNQVIEVRISHGTAVSLVTLVINGPIWVKPWSPWSPRSHNVWWTQ